MPTKKTGKVTKQTKPTTPPLKALSEAELQREGFILGHMVKYNLYLVAKALVFQAVAAKFETINTAITETNRIMDELDLDSKAQKAQAEKADS